MVKGFWWIVVAALGVSLIACSSAQSGHEYKRSASTWQLSEQYAIGDSFMGVRLLGAVRLNNGKVDGLKVTELSGLAWDADENLLYAVSDGGFLYHLAVEIEKGHLLNAKVMRAFRLHNKKGEALKGLQNEDAEGLTLLNANNGQKGDSELWVSFEQKPRVIRYDAEGKYLAALELPDVLQDINDYVGNNKALEAIAIHSKYTAITAPEKPLKQEKEAYHRLFALDKNQSSWLFEKTSVPNSAITGLEALPDGSILVLERAKNTINLVISLRRVNIDACLSEKVCPVETIATFDNNEGWFIDNFEGLTHYRDNLYFMVSDNNNKPFFQNTLLVLFELSEAYKAQNM